MPMYAKTFPWGGPGEGKVCREKGREVSGREKENKGMTREKNS